MSAPMLSSTKSRMAATSAPVKLSSTMQVIMVELSKRYARQQTLIHLENRIAELQARRAFHLDPTPANLTAWCDLNELVEAGK